MMKIIPKQSCQRSSRACEWLAKLQLQVGVVALGGAVVMAGCADRKTASSTEADRQVILDPTLTVTPSRTITTAATSPTTQAASEERLEPTGRVAGQATVVLDEERLDVQKRTVPAGGVLITKDVETREVTQPVELRTETVEVERLSPEEARKREITAKGGTIDAKGEIFVPLEREVAVVEKVVQPREVVTATTASAVEQEDVGATLRREVVDIERRGSVQTGQAGAPTGRTETQAGQTGTQSAQSSPMEQRIRTELREANLGLQEQQLNQMQIRIEQNTVTLSGTVPNQETARAIEQRVRQMDGVQNVQNQLRVNQ